MLFINSTLVVFIWFYYNIPYCINTTINIHTHVGIMFSLLYRKARQKLCKTESQLIFPIEKGLP